MKKLNLFIPITKVDEERRIVYGVATAEQPDQSGEICDYESTVPYYKLWSDRIHKASEGKSKGNLRAMHQPIAAGKVTQISFNDSQKQIEIAAKVVDDDEWSKVIEGVYTGFSQGGRYVKTWQDGQFVRYTADPSEISLVDNPCLPSATFTLLRSGGAKELRKFKSLESNTMAELSQVWKAADGSTYPTKAEAVKKNAELEAQALAQPAVDALAKIVTKLDGDVKSEEEGRKEEADQPKDKKESDAKTDREQSEVIEKSHHKQSCGFKKFVGTEIFDAKMAIEALCLISALFEMEQSEPENEQSQLSDLKVVIDKLKSFIASEINESTSINEPDMDIEGVQKRGAMLSGASKAHISRMHKSAQMHMSTMDECAKSLGLSTENNETDTSETAEKMHKLQAEKDSLNKTIESLNQSMHTLLKRVESLEAQPLPPKGKLYALEKGHEVDSRSAPVEIPSHPVNIMPNNISPAEYRQRYSS